MFSNALFCVRVLMRSGEPWFIAADVCKGLEILNPSDAYANLESEDKMVLTRSELNTLDSTEGIDSRVQSLILVSEPGLYDLVMQSRKQVAKTFKKWVTHEVIPSIRKNGFYAIQKTQATLPVVSEEDHFFLNILHADSKEQTALALKEYKSYRDERERELEREKDDAVRKRTAINDKRTATLMVAKREDNKKINRLTCENNELKEQNEVLQKEKERLTKSFGCTPQKHDWLTVSVMRDVWQRNFKKDPQWQDLKRIIKENSLVDPIKDVKEIVNNKEKFVNRYPRRAWEIYFDEETERKNKTEE